MTLINAYPQQERTSVLHVCLIIIFSKKMLFFSVNRDGLRNPRSFIKAVKWKH